MCQLIIWVTIPQITTTRTKVLLNNIKALYNFGQSLGPLLVSKSGFQLNHHISNIYKYRCIEELQSGVHVLAGAEGG